MYQEYHHKFDEVWIDNNASVTYKQKNRWIPISKNMDDKVTILNVPLASVGALAENLPKATRVALNMALVMLGTNFSIFPQCGTLRIFLPFRFSVKSMFEKKLQRV